MQSRTVKKESSSQLPLWNDIRIPLEYLAFFRTDGECLNCGQKLRHELHAFNHWKRYHSRIKDKKPVETIIRQRFYVWLGGAWKESGLMEFLYAKSLGIPTAFTKERTKGEGKGKPKN